MKIPTRPFRSLDCDHFLNAGFGLNLLYPGNDSVVDIADNLQKLGLVDPVNIAHMSISDCFSWKRMIHKACHIAINTDQLTCKIIFVKIKLGVDAGMIEQNPSTLHARLHIRQTIKCRHDLQTYRFPGSIEAGGFQNDFQLNIAGGEGQLRP
ncbi:hypothetical protein D3C76_1281310 [compost metagenome]